MPNSARGQRQNDDRPAQVVGRAQRARPQPQQRRGTDLQEKLDKRKARSVCHACDQTRHWARDPQCPGRPVNVIELDDEVQEFEPNQDAGTRQVLSVQFDVSDVRPPRPFTRLKLRHCSPLHSSWQSLRPCQILAERGIRHLIKVMPKSEVYRFGNGGLLTSTADHPLLLSYSVVEALCYPCSW